MLLFPGTIVAKISVGVDEANVTIHGDIQKPLNLTLGMMKVAGAGPGIRAAEHGSWTVQLNDVCLYYTQLKMTNRREKPVSSGQSKRFVYDSKGLATLRGLLMFTKTSDRDYLQPADKIRMKTLVYGEKTLMSEFRLEQGAQLARHSHPHEQTGYLVSGALRLTIGTDLYAVRPGDSWCIPADVEHQAEAVEQAVVIEVFAPLRKDYLP